MMLKRNTTHISAKTVHIGKEKFLFAPTISKISALHHHKELSHFTSSPRLGMFESHIR